MDPITRKEMYLAKMAGEEIAVPVPITREEIYLAYLAGEAVDLPGKPITNDECFLARLCGAPAPELKPLTRKQMLMTEAIAKKVPDFTTITREEYFWKAYIDSLGPKIVYKTVSGAVASFDDGADDMPIRSLEVEINPVQEGSGDPSPENIRPITGWDSIHVYHSGADTSDPDMVTVQMPTPPGAVYGGTLDVTTGELILTHGFYSFTGSETLSLIATGYTRFWYSFDTDDKKAVGTNQIFSWTKYANVPTAASPSGNPVYGAKVYNYSGGARVIFSDPSFPTTKSEMSEILRTAHELGTPYCFTYQLEQPITYHLTPQEVRTLLGENRIWADSGDVTVEYPAVEQEEENA